MSFSRREDEKVIKEIVKRDVKSMTPEQKVKLFVYYKTGKTSHLQLCTRTAVLLEIVSSNIITSACLRQLLAAD